MLCPELRLKLHRRWLNQLSNQQNTINMLENMYELESEVKHYIFFSLKPDLHNLILYENNINTSISCLKF
ncbi:hypothetical protein Hanom_Chr13g01206281 [Helianthus anomalus]